MTPALSNTKNYRGVIANEGNYGQFLEETIIPHEGDIGTRCSQHSILVSTNNCGSIAVKTGRHGALMEEAISQYKGDRCRAPCNQNVLNRHQEC